MPLTNKFNPVKYKMAEGTGHLCEFKLKWFDDSGDLVEITTLDPEVALEIMSLLTGETCLADYNP